MTPINREVKITYTPTVLLQTAGLGLRSEVEAHFRTMKMQPFWKKRWSADWEPGENPEQRGRSCMFVCVGQLDSLPEGRRRVVSLRGHPGTVKTNKAGSRSGYRVTG